MKPLHTLLAAALAVAALACTAQTATPAEPESQRLAQELRTLIGPAACTADNQCRSLPIGAKACGGPAGYIAWSTQGMDPQRVAELAARQAQAHKREIEAGGLRSNCAVVTDPGVGCVAGHCQLSPAAAPRTGVQ